MSSPPKSPVSPTGKARRAIPHGFLATPKAKTKTVPEMTLRELHDRHYQNKQFLAAPCVLQAIPFFMYADSLCRGASTSAYITKVLLEQNAIETQLAELEGVDNINAGMRNTRIVDDDDDMDVDGAPEAPVRTIDTKRRVLARAYVRAGSPSKHSIY